MAQTGGLNERVRAALAALWHAGDTGREPIDPLRGDGPALSDEIEMAVAHRS
jgi:hypothetical protein